MAERKLYYYKILFGSGLSIELKGCPNRIDFKALTKNNWTTIDLENLGKRHLINMSQVLTIEETIKE